MASLFSIGFFRHSAGSILKFFFENFSIDQGMKSFSPYLHLVHKNSHEWDHTSKILSGRVTCYRLIKYEEELYIFLNINRVSWIHMRKMLSDITLIMVERTMYLAIILLSVQYKLHNHWSDGKNSAKVRTVN